jgi:hypothetical protein
VYNMTMGLPEIEGYNPEGSKQVAEAIEILAAANALLPIVLVSKEGNKTLQVNHKRNVADDTDIYEQKETEPELIDSYKRIHADKYTPGKKIKIYGVEFNAQEKVDHIHTDGLDINYEDPVARLVPTNPMHTEKINVLLSEALTQTRERVVKSMEAQKKNIQNTQDTFKKFLEDLI